MTAVRFEDIRVGMRFPTKAGFTVEVVSWERWDKIVVRFVDVSNPREKVVSMSALNDGVIGYGDRECLPFGYFGEGEYDSGSFGGKAYFTWNSMLRRVYSAKQQKTCPSYISCSIDEDWHNFQNFAKWFEDNHVVGWQLDKDLLSGRSKGYSKKTCCFIPPCINKFLISGYPDRELPLGVSIKSGREHKNNKFLGQVYFRGKIYSKTFPTIEEAQEFYHNKKKECLEVLIADYPELPKRVVDAMRKWDFRVGNKN